MHDVNLVLQKGSLITGTSWSLPCAGRKGLCFNFLCHWSTFVDCILHSSWMFDFCIGVFAPWTMYKFNCRGNFPYLEALWSLSSPPTEHLLHEILHEVLPNLPRCMEFISNLSQIPFKSSNSAGDLWCRNHGFNAIAACEHKDACMLGMFHVSWFLFL